MTEQQTKIGELQPLIDATPFKGIQAFDTPYLIERNHCVDCQNITFEQQLGAYFTVKGRLPNVGNLPNLSLGFTRLDFLPLTPGTFVGASDSTLGVTASIQEWNPGVPPIALSLAKLTFTMTPSQPTYWANASTNFGAWAFGVNGVDPMWKVDGLATPSVVTNAQIAAPATAPAVAAGGAGNLTSNNNPYVWCVTFGTSQQESGQGTVSLALNLTAQQANLSNIPISTDPQTTQRTIYRLGGTSSQFREVGVINDNTTTTFVDNVADSNLGHALVITRDVPPTGIHFLVLHKDRLFGFRSAADEAGLWYSNYVEPWGWNLTTQYFAVGKSTVADGGQGLASTGSVLVLFKNMTTWVLYGDDPTTFVNPRKILDVGCLAPRSIASALGVVFWLSSDGAWMFDGNQPVRISANLQNILYNISTSDQQRAVGTYSKGIYYLSFPVQGVTYAYSVALQEWTKVKNAMETAWFDSSNLLVYGSRPGTGNIDQWFASFTDVGTPIVASWLGKPEDSGMPQARKRARYLKVVAPVQKGQSVTVSLILEPSTTTPTTYTRLVDLGAGPIQQFSIPSPAKYQEAQLLVSSTSTTTQVIVQRVQIIGYVDSEYTVPQ